MQITPMQSAKPPVNVITGVEGAANSVDPESVRNAKEEDDPWRILYGPEEGPYDNDNPTADIFRNE